MSGMWSFRPAGSTAGPDSVPHLVREALPLATLEYDAVSPRPQSDTYDDEEFDRLVDSGDELYPSEGEEAGADVDESHSAWLNRVATSFDAGGDKSLSEMERVLIELRTSGGSLHETLVHNGNATLNDGHCPRTAPEEQRIFDALHSLSAPPAATPAASGQLGAPRRQSLVASKAPASSSAETFKTAQRSAEQVKRREALRYEARLAAQTASRARKETQQATRREAKAVLERLQLEQDKVADELERRKCLQAITNIQRSQTALHAHQQLQSKQQKRCVPVVGRQEVHLLQQQQQSFPAESLVNRDPAKPQQRVARERRDDTNDAPYAPGVSSAGPPHASFRDPWQRLFSTTTRREAEIAKLQQAGRVILDPREAKERRLQSVAARPSSKAVQQAALNDRIESHSRIRILKHYAWQPWRKVVLLQKCLLMQAHTHNRLARLVSAMRVWRSIVVGCKTTRFVVRCARAVALIRFLQFCWKRRTFFSWRSKIILRRAHEREADRFRRRTLWVAWETACRHRREDAEQQMDAVADRRAFALIRQTKRNAFRKWKDAAEARNLSRVRAEFRNALRDAMSASDVASTSSFRGGGGGAQPPLALDHVPAFLQSSNVPTTRY